MEQIRTRRSPAQEVGEDLFLDPAKLIKPGQIYLLENRPDEWNFSFGKHDCSGSFFPCLAEII